MIPLVSHTTRSRSELVAADTHIGAADVTWPAKSVHG